jgi:hypothetical protein
MTIAVRFIVTLCVILGTLPLSAQFNPNLSHYFPDPSQFPRTVQYNVTNAGQNPASFYMFGDGHYSSALQPQHEMETGGSILTLAHYVEPYKVDKPTPRSENVNVPVPPGGRVPSTTARPFMGGQSIRVGQSWSAALDNELIYIISFTHPCSNSGVLADGKVRFFLDNGVSINQIYSPAVGWADYHSTQNANRAGFGKEIIWDYENLAPGEIRHLYVHIDIPAGFNKAGVSRLATIEAQEPDSGMTICDATDAGSSKIQRHPHDPNSIEVDFACIRSGWGQSQELEYTINFQNSGEGFAKDIIIDVSLLGEVAISSAELESSSLPCTLTEDGHMIQIQLLNAMLPGSNQIFPNTYSYDQTTGFVKFRVCTYPDVMPGEFIFGDAVIFFDTQPGIYTNTAVTSFESSCKIGPDCAMDRSLTEKEKLEETSVVQVYPNPFNETLTVDFQVEAPAGEEVLIRLRSINGMDAVRPLYQGVRPYGPHSLQLPTGNLPKGLYFLETQIGGRISVQKVTKF